MSLLNDDDVVIMRLLILIIMIIMISAKINKKLFLHNTNVPKRICWLDLFPLLSLKTCHYLVCFASAEAAENKDMK